MRRLSCTAKRAPSNAPITTRSTKVHKSLYLRRQIRHKITLEAKAWGHLMSINDPKVGWALEESDKSAWQSSARLMPSPADAFEKAAIAASFQAKPLRKNVNKARMAVGAAVVAIAVSVPNLSLEAMVNTLGVKTLAEHTIGSKGLGLSAIGAGDATARRRALPQGDRPQQVWTPSSLGVSRDAGSPLGKAVVGALEPSLGELPPIAPSYVSTPALNDFERELPLSVLDRGSPEFDLAFAGVEMPDVRTALIAPRLPDDTPTLGLASVDRSQGIATQTIAIEQITDLDLVVKATPENAGEDTSALSVGASAARIDAIASRSVEAAFAGAIDASSAVRTSLPIAPQKTANQTAAPMPEVSRAISVAAPPQELRGAAAAQAMLVPKSKMDARVNGVLTGSVDFEQRDGTIAIRLRSVANMMREQFTKTEFSSLVGGSKIDSFVTLEQLQAAGIPINYNPAYDEVEFGIDYQDAPNAKKVQVDQISVPQFGSDVTVIEQIPR